MTGQTKEITKPQGTKRELREWLQGETFKRELAALLPRTMSPERFVRIAFQAIHRTPELLKCSQESFFNCLLQLGAMGLEPDGRRAHLIPFGQECTLVVDYKGIKELVRRNHDVSAMHCDVVGANDEFELRFGTHGVLDHKPSLEDRGKILCAYSWVKLPDGNEEFDVMSVTEIEAIRKRSRSPNKGPWVTDWNEMAKKTVFRRHSKGLPLSPETREALDRETDADSLTEQERFNAAVPANVLGNSAAARPAARTREQRARQPKLDATDQDDAGAADEPDAPGDRASASNDSAPPAPAPAVSRADEIRLMLEEAGFSESELLDLMKALKLAPAQAKSLDDCNDQRLEMVVEDWVACKDRLGALRQQRKSGAAA
jgi:recombination protein RecT